MRASARREGAGPQPGGMEAAQAEMPAGSLPVQREEGLVAVEELFMAADG